MNTITHILIAYAVVKYYRTKKNVEIPKSFILGSFAPDILFYFICIYSFIFYSLTTSMTTLEIFSYMFDYLYFNDSVWKFSYNILHSPFVIIAMLCVMLATIRNNITLYKGMGQFKKNEKVSLKKLQQHFPYVIMILFFFIGCLVHISLDIPLNHDDGPLLLYPINDELRFYSPISYWDPNHYGGIFTIFETLLMFSLIGYLIKDWALKKFNRKEKKIKNKWNRV